MTDQEIELKLEIDAEGAERLQASPLVESAAVKTKDQVSTYYDTRKSALRKAGLSLRVRITGSTIVQTMKHTPESAGLFSRSEWEWPIAGATPDRMVLDGTPAAAVLGSSKLLPIAETRIYRMVWDISRKRGAIEVALDQGTVSAGGRSSPIDELELELKAGDKRILFNFVRDLARDVTVRLAVQTKAERSFALADGRLGKVTKAAPVHVSPEMIVADAFTAIARTCLKHFRLNEDPLARDRDPAGLHQARVAMRRLRSALSLFRPALRDEEFERLRTELRWFTGELGQARNLDVMIGIIREHNVDVPHDLSARRQQAYDAAIAALGSSRVRDLMLDLVRWIEIGTWRSSSKARHPIPPFAAKRLNRLWDRVAATAPDLTSLDDEGRHRLRIEIKKLRYASEFLAGLHPDKAIEVKRFGKRLQAAQDSMGHLNDIATGRTLFGRAPDELSADPFGMEAEQEHLAGSAKQLRQLLKIGPFWRDVSHTVAAPGKRGLTVAA